MPAAAAEELPVAVDDFPAAEDVPILPDEGQANSERYPSRSRAQRQHFDSNSFDQARILENANVADEEPSRVQDQLFDPADEESRSSDPEEKEDQVYVSLSARASDLSDPDGFKEAIISCHKHHWVQACKEEIAAQNKNHTWDIVVLPSGVKTIGSRWVFKTKRDRNGDPTRFKARLVAQGFSQVPGVNYGETFSPTLKMNTMRMFMATAVHKNWAIRQLDVKTAFLIPELPENEVIFMRAPPLVDVPPGHALRLRRTIYGLKQASHHWHSEFDKTVVSLDFVPSTADPCLYVQVRDGALQAMIAIFVDDCLVSGPTDIADATCDKLMSTYEMTNSGTPEWFLGIAVDYDQAAAWHSPPFTTCVR